MTIVHANHLILSRILTILMVTITGMLIFQPDLPSIQSLVNYAEWVAIGFTLFGLGMIALNQKRLMFVSMLSAAAVCLYFDQPESPVINKSYLVSNIQTNTEFKIGHCNLSNHNGEPAAMLRYMRAQDADIITMLEYTVGWDSLLESTMQASYPYSLTRPDLGYKGIAIYSRLPFMPFDSLETQHARMYAVRINLDNAQGDLACFLNMIPITPGVQGDSLRNTFMDSVTVHINKSTLPSLVLGEFSNPNWNNSIRNFRTECNLLNSRVGMIITPPCEPFPNFRVPSEHIFYTPTIECTAFQPIGNPHSDYIGLTGTYRLKPNVHVDQ